MRPATIAIIAAGLACLAAAWIVYHAAADRPAPRPTRRILGADTSSPSRYDAWLDRVENEFPPFPDNLGDLVTYRGRVVRRDDEQPVEGARVSFVANIAPPRGLLRQSPVPTATVESESDGTFSCRIPRRDYFAVASARSYGKTAHYRLTLQRPFEIALATAVSLHGVVLESGGEVVAGATVVALQETGHGQSPPPEGVLGRTTSDAAGRFRFDGLPLAGYLSLVAWAPGQGFGRALPVEEAQVHVIQLKAGRKVQVGFVQRGSGDPVSDVRVAWVENPHTENMSAWPRYEVTRTRCEVWMQRDTPGRLLIESGPAFHARWVEVTEDTMSAHVELTPLKRH